MIRGTAGLVRSLIVYWRPGRQRALRRLYAPFVGPGDLVFDVGAHLGDRAAAFSALGAHVVALEPQPRLAHWLRRMVRRRESIEVVEEAVGAEAGTATLAVSQANPTVSTLAHEWRESIGAANPSFSKVQWEESVDVPVTTLDALRDRFGEPRFCKIDVEGHEAEVLAGMSFTVEALSVEFVAGSLEITRRCVDRLEELGDYRYNVIEGEGRTFKFRRWVSRVAVDAWLDQGVGGASSGDLYAWRADVMAGAGTDELQA